MQRRQPHQKLHDLQTVLNGLVVRRCLSQRRFPALLQRIHLVQCLEQLALRGNMGRQNRRHLCCGGPGRKCLRFLLQQNKRRCRTPGQEIVDEIFSVPEIHIDGHDNHIRPGGFDHAHAQNTVICRTNNPEPLRIAQQNGFNMLRQGMKGQDHQNRQHRTPFHHLAKKQTARLRI